MRTITFLADTTNGAPTPSTTLKQWVGSTTSNSSGVWAVDISSAGFQTVVTVVATAQANQTAVANIPFATVRTYTTKTVTGYVLRSNSGMIVLGGSWTGVNMSNTATTVFVHVVGY